MPVCLYTCILYTCILSFQNGSAECAKRLNPPPPGEHGVLNHSAKACTSQICKNLNANLKNSADISNPPSPRRPRAFRRAPPKDVVRRPSAKTKYCSVCVHVCQMSARVRCWSALFPGRKPQLLLSVPAKTPICDFAVFGPCRDTLQNSRLLASSSFSAPLKCSSGFYL